MRVLIAGRGEGVGELGAVLGAAGYKVDFVGGGRGRGRVGSGGYDFVVFDGGEEEVIRNGNVELDVERHVIRRNRKTVRATPLEFKIIRFFMEHRGRIVTKDDLAAGCWGEGARVSGNTIEVYIKRIRDKLGASSIRTIHGIGYQMEKR